MATTEPNLKDIHDFLVELAKRAGEMFITAHQSALITGFKKNSADLVTETDKEVEQMVTNALKKEYPDYEFMGEETYRPDMKLTDTPTFICDPIDGTTNFIHRFPGACISLALAIEKRPVIGVVYNPFQHCLFTAIHKQGAHLNLTTPLPLNPVPEPLSDLSAALVAVEWNSIRAGPNAEVRRRTFDNLTATKEAGGAMVQGLRCLGSAALNICGVAAGYLDLYWDLGPWPWDVAAGWIILEEAGGLVVDGNPNNWNPDLDGRIFLFVRGAPSGQTKIVEEFWGHVVGRFEK